MDPIAKVFFEYLRDIIYNPTRAALNVEVLPQDFRDLGEALRYLAACIGETRDLAHALSKGNLSGPLPSRGNELAAPLKALHASLQHLTWQTQQVAQGDYQQRVEFMGHFSTAFNTMVEQLDERSKTEADAKSKLQRYVNLLLSNCPDIILLFDGSGQLVSTSDAYLRCNNMESPDSLQRRSFQDLFSSVTSAEFLQNMDELLQAALAEKRSSEIEQAIAFGKGGNVRHYRIQVTPILDDLGMAVGTLLFFIDMTENIRAQQEAERARELAEQAARAKSEFLARMSHEMHTPMNAILGMTALARTFDEPERRIHCLNKIQEASQHLLGLINDILDMSKLESDEFKLSLGDCDFAEMMQNAAGAMQFRVDERKQTISMDIDGDIPANILADKHRLAHIITILLSNAIKFTPEHGVISLTARKTAEDGGMCTIQCTVKDTGIGISKEQQQRLFVLFEQADGGLSRKFGGTGLGLALAKRIIELMDGRIWVESELGKGAAFIFEFKAKTDGEAPTAPPGGAAAVADSSRQTREAQDGIAPGMELFAGKRILVAEDVEINCEIIASLLEDTGIACVFACDGTEAVAKFSATPKDYDLILMDIHMPEMDGHEATRLIRASGLEGADSIPIIAATANTFPEDIDRCLDAGMDSHLGKPVVPELLIAELKKYLA